MIFRRALIRLTVTYTVVQLLLFGAFGIGIYFFVTGTFDFDRPELNGEAFLASAEQGFALLRSGLIVGYAVLVVVLPVSSYLMARGALAPVRRSYELQQRFVDGASHEFRSPLSVIQGELELALSRARTPAQYRTAIGRALEASEGLTRLTDDLLLLSRGDTSDLQASFEPVSLTTLIADVVRDRQSSRISVAESPEVVVMGSVELLTRAIANLVDNAEKFTDPGGRIQITLGSAGRVAHVEVRDDGVGMTETQLTRVFDRFWRAQGARETPGFGLGLSLVREIMTAHQGKVAIASSPGAGTVVTLTLPERSR